MTRRKPLIKEICFDLVVKETLCDLFNLLIKAEVYLDEMKINFNEKNLDLNLFFELMDKERNGFLTLNEVRIYID